MTDLLDLLADLEPPCTTVHILMPCMTYVCGGSILDTPGRFQVGINDWDAITCPGCRAPGADSIVADTRRQQGSQAAVA